MICPCGICCEKCPKFPKECAGCHAIKGRVFWARYVGADVCPIYQCAKDKRLAHCGDCAHVPCQLWVSLKDPALSDDEHQQSINERVAALKSLRKGTGSQV